MATSESSAEYQRTTLSGAPWLQTSSLDEAQPKIKRHFSSKKWLKRTLLLMLVAIMSIGSWLGYKLYADASKITGNKNPISLLSTFTPTTLKETNGRVNILLAGYSDDDNGHQGADLTDSIMILSINPTTKSAVVMSVPRDLYVNILGYGYSKINAAYEYGESEKFSTSGYASGGMGLLEETISQDFGVSFDYYGLINYTAFKDAVEAVGGVSVTINSSDSRGLYDPNTNLNLPNGTVTLNGQQALDLARARGDGFTDGDFDRTEHQQELLLALKDKISSASVISNPLKIASVADALGNNVKTDMTIGEMETLYTKVKGITDSNIKTVTLNSYAGKDYLAGYTTASGQSTLIPAAGIDDYSNIQTLLSSLLSPTNSSDSSD